MSLFVLNKTCKSIVYSLEYSGGLCYTESAERRRSILVRSAVSEEGPKNPLKGISEKPVVSASNAQFGVDAAGRYLGTCVFRAISNGMEDPTLFTRRPAFVHGRTPFGKRIMYGAGLNL